MTFLCTGKPKTHGTRFVAISALLERCGTEPSTSLRSACVLWVWSTGCLWGTLALTRYSQLLRAPFCARPQPGPVWTRRALTWLLTAQGRTLGTTWACPALAQEDQGCRQHTAPAHARDSARLGAADPEGFLWASHPLLPPVICHFPDATEPLLTPPCPFLAL